MSRWAYVLWHSIMLLVHDWAANQASLPSAYDAGPMFCCAVVINTEEDIARFTVAAIGDERAINKSLHIRPKLNTLTQHDLVRRVALLLASKAACISEPSLPAPCGQGSVISVAFKGL